MRYLVALLALLCLSAAPVSAQTSDTVEQKLREIATWASSYHAINGEITALYTSANDLNAIQERFNAGDLKAEAAVAAVEAWRAAAIQRTATMRTRLGEIPTPPRIGSAFGPGEDAVRLQGFIDGLGQRFHDTVDNGEAFVNTLANMALQGVRGEADAVRVSIDRTMEVSRRLLETANDALAMTLAISPTDHPAYSIASGRIAFNNAMITSLSVLRDSVLEEEIVYSEENRADVRSMLRTIREQVRSGRTHMVAARSRLGPTMSPSLRAKFTRFYDSMSELLDTLTSAAALIERVADLPSGGKLEQLLTIFDQFDVVDTALDQQNIRRAEIMAQPAPPI